MFTDIKAIIFDMDGLIIDTEPTWRRVMIGVFRTVGIELDEETCMQTMGLRTDEAIDYWYRKHPWSNRSKSELIKDILDAMKQAIEAEGQAMPGFMRLLDYVVSEKYPIAIASSSPEVLIKATMKRLQLESKIPVFCSAEKEDYGKPHPAVFLSAAQALGVDPTECLVFEDSVAGVIAAKAARMKAIAVPEPEHFNDKRFAVADKIMRSLEELSL